MFSNIVSSLSTTESGQMKYKRGWPWKWILLGLGIVVVGLVLWKFVIPPPMPVISYFTANPTSITAGDGTTLSWSVSGATEVGIDPGMESVIGTGTRTVFPTESTIYTLRTSNKAGRRSATVQVTVVTLPVVNAFTADPTSIDSGDSSTLSWNVSDATEVIIDHGIGSVPRTGIRTVSPDTTTTYTLDASNEAGGSTATVQVTVSAPGSPLINYFTANPTSIAAGDSSTLGWSVSGASEVTMYEGIGTVPLTGTRTVYPSTTTTYTLWAGNEAGSRTATVQVTVSAPSPGSPAINYFQANPTSIATGDSSTLSWSVSGATEVAIDHGIGSVGPGGSRTVHPTTTTTYTLEASNEAGTSTDTVQITVSAPSPGAPVINYFDANPTSIATGDSSTLSWSVSGASEVIMYQGIGTVPLTGTRTVYPSTTTTYTLWAGNEAGSRTATVQVTVIAMPLTDSLIAAGHEHTVGVKPDGTIVDVGSNYYGQRDTGGWTDIVAVAASSGTTVGIESDGTVVAEGWNDYEQCNVGSWTDIIQVSAVLYHTVGLKSDGTVVAVGYAADGQCSVGGWTNIIQVAAGDRHTVGLRENGAVVAVGSNTSGQCDVDGWTNIIQISAGQAHTVGLKSDGTVVAAGITTGLGDYGQCDVGGWTNIVQVSAGWQHTVGLKPDGTVVVVGKDENGQRDVGSWTDIVQVSAGNYHTVGLKSDGTVVVTGCQGYDLGQCDVGGWDLIT